LGGKSLIKSWNYAPKYLSLGILIKQIKVMKKTNRSVSGTSFHDVTIKTSIKALKAVLGEPTYTGDPIEDKVQVEWICETQEGNVVTIYDWKEYRILLQSEEVEFHIGGFTYFDTLDAKNELIKLLN
jgi:hypothetical protein